MSTSNIRAALERLRNAVIEMVQRAQTALDVGTSFTPPEPAPELPTEALAARPLLEKVARLGDVIGQQTVAEVQQLANQAAAWLRSNPPGQSVAIEPRGCPTPGACSCVEPTTPAPEPSNAMQRLLSAPMDARGYADLRSTTPPAPEPGEVAELLDRLGWIAAQLGDIDWEDDSVSVTRAATLLQQLASGAGTWCCAGKAMSNQFPDATKMVHTDSDRLALAVCTSTRPDRDSDRDNDGERPCAVPCSTCRVGAAAVAHEIAQLLRERHGGSSVTADWLDGVGAHPSPHPRHPVGGVTFFRSAPPMAHPKP